MNAAQRSELLVQHLSRFLQRHCANDNPQLNRITEQLVRQTVDGHIAINLHDQTDVETGAALSTSQLSKLRDVLMTSKIVGEPGSYNPLILDDSNRLYLHRYWDYEQRVVDMLCQRAARQNKNIDKSQIKKRLSLLFPGANETGQKTAAAIAALRYLTVVSGGPGTGKTTAVVRILALLLKMNPSLDIAIAAPTGKAAARASDAVRQAGQTLLPDQAAREQIPREAKTIHRLLGMRPGYSRFNADNLLPHDVVVIDEASMIGISLMAQLLDALRPDCRLILLGDKDQLSSVEPGSVLGDICGTTNQYSAELAAELQTLGIDQPATSTATHALQDCVVRLTHSFRFGAQSGIGRLAAAIRQGDADAALELLNDPAIAEVRLYESDSVRVLHDILAPDLLSHMQGYLQNISTGAEPAEVLSSFDSFRLLCAVREGQTGVSGLNRLSAQVLADNGLIDPGDTWYSGRPVMISSNDYMLQLFNGDIGITLRDPDDDQPRVIFESPDGIRNLHTPRLPAHQTVFAMTVHKAQGSEFDAVALVLPDKPGELLGRELIYTAVTRARHTVAIYGRAEVLHAAIGRVGKHESGLADKLQITGTAKPQQQSLF